MCTGVTKFFHIDSTGNLRQRGANQKYMKQKMKLGGTRCKLKTEKTEKGQLSGTWCNSVVIGANKKYLHQVPPSCTQLHQVQRVPALRAFWDLEKPVLHEILVSGTFCSFLYFGVTFFCFIYFYFAPSTTEMH